jgi:predicted permease
MLLIRRMMNLFSRSRIEREIDAELKSHIEMRIEDNLAEGMRLEDARRDARLRFGNPVAVKERVTGVDAALLLDSIWSDIRYALHQLTQNPGFSSAVIAVLALGICASVSIFAFVDAALIKPLPYKNPKQLVGLFESTPLGSRFHLSYLDYLDWKRMNTVFSSVEAYDYDSFTLNSATGLVHADGVTVSSGFFRTLGVTPILGRDFRAGEDSSGAAGVVLLSYAAWQSRYGGRQDVVGKTVTLNGTSNVIVGVLPQWFHFAPVGPADFWTALRESTDPNGRGEHGLFAIAQLKDGVSLGTAAADINSVAQQLAKQYPDADGGRGATVLPLTQVIVGNLRPILLLLLSGAALLLLIACVNVSSLLLVRTESRQRELAVRGALGASYARLIRQFATEALTLAGTGSILGVSAAYGAMRLLTRLIPAEKLAYMPYLRDLGLDIHVAIFAGVLGCASWLLFSITPIARLSMANLRNGFPEGGRTTSGSVWRRLGSSLVVLELCTATVLLVGAGLLGQSFYRLLHTDVGFQPDHLAILRLSASGKAYAKDEQAVALAAQVVREVKSLPGVQSVAIARSLPVADVNGGNSGFEIVGRPGPSGGREANTRQVSADYFSTLKARLLRGRFFTADEGASKPLVTVINQSFARKYFAGEDPLGKQIRFDASQPPIEIVGVVDNMKEGPLDSDLPPALYTPFAQGPDPRFVVIARTAPTPQTLLKTMEGTIRRIDPQILTSGAETMVDRINLSQSAYLHSASAWLVGGFAAIALVLGVVGLYGVVAYSVSQRTREIGVRIALGAQRSTVCALILREAGLLVLIGVAAGLGGSVAGAILMRNLLFDIQPWDASTLSAVAAVLAFTALLASYFPARRAASVNPVDALRAE